MFCEPMGGSEQQCTEQPDRYLTCSADISLAAQNMDAGSHIYVAMGTGLGSCMADSDCGVGYMCSGKAPPGTCQPIANGGRC